MGWRQVGCCGVGSEGLITVGEVGGGDYIRVVRLIMKGVGKIEACDSWDRSQGEDGDGWESRTDEWMGGEEKEQGVGCGVSLTLE